MTNVKLFGGWSLTLVSSQSTRSFRLQAIFDSFAAGRPDGRSSTVPSAGRRLALNARWVEIGGLLAWFPFDIAAKTGLLLLRNRFATQDCIECLP